MQAPELGSELSRAMLGIVPTSSVPEIVLNQFTLISWDHKVNPGIIWRLSGLTWQDLSEEKVFSIDGFKITNSEVVAVIRGGELLALIPEGSWIMKPEAEMRALEMYAGNVELVWIDLRPIALQFEVNDLRTETGRHHLQGELSLQVADPAKLASKFVLMNDKASSKDIQDDVLEELLDLMSGEASTRNSADPSWKQHVEEGSKTKLVKKLSDWGLMPMDLRITEPKSIGSAQSVRGKEVEDIKATQPLKGAGPSPKTRLPVEATPRSSRTKLSGSDSNLIKMLEWDTTPKRWIPLNQKGKVKCDGCGEHAEVFAECRLSCRFPQKCTLCKRCYPKRDNCAFLVEVQDVPLAHARMEERLTQSAKIDVERELGSKTAPQWGGAQSNSTLNKLH